MKVLIVEDQKDLVEMFDSLLNGRAVVVDNADTAMSLLDSVKFAAVYCDVHGIEANGYSYKSVAAKCEAIGVDCYCISSDIDVQQIPKHKVIEHADSAIARVVG